ncbi:MAG TPA: polysaccharide deacetylase family protein [Candidatus Paceibacterota bacterium]|nr:polysaccharide deacetylase family protein [Candidatus Paceibacterota bacterium]
MRARCTGGLGRHGFPGQGARLAALWIAIAAFTASCQRDSRLELGSAPSAVGPGPDRACAAGVTWQGGAIVRGPTDCRRLALVFTGHEFAEGGSIILDALGRHKARTSFFLTGDFLANPEFASLVRRMVREGHYVGAHSDRHLLYCDWDAQRRTLVTRGAFRDDLDANYRKLAAFGVTRRAAPIFLPPYEHFNADIVRWTRELGLTLVNYTPGTRSAADYTGERDANFTSSEAIFESIVRRESADPHGLNGFLLLLHLGAGPGRADKMHSRFDALLDWLEARGYTFARVDELLYRAT